jgi:ribosomal protein S18 acetylase RimI-like enzyme
LILVDGGMCHYHLRRDGQLTILEIIILPQAEGRGVAYAILAQLQALNPVSIFAKCPVDLARANAWYRRQGFNLERTETTKTGRELNCWRR